MYQIDRRGGGSINRSLGNYHKIDIKGGGGGGLTKAFTSTEHFKVVHKKLSYYFI